MHEQATVDAKHNLSENSHWCHSYSLQHRDEADRSLCKKQKLSKKMAIVSAKHAYKAFGERDSATPVSTARVFSRASSVRNCIRDMQTMQYITNVCNLFVQKIARVLNVETTQILLQSSACMTVMYRAKTNQPKPVCQTGSTSTFEPGIHRFMNSAISRQDPVPDNDCTAATLLSAMASLLSPYASLMDTWLKSFRPPIGRYLQAHHCGNQLEQLMVNALLHILLHKAAQS